MAKSSNLGGGWADGLLAAVLGWDFVDHAGYSRPRIAVDMAVANEATHTIPLVVVLKQPDFWLVSQDGERTLAQHGYSGGIEWCQGSYLGPREAVVCSYEFSLSGHAANALIVFQPLSVSETVSVDLGPEPISAAMPFEDRADIRTPSLGQPVDFDTGLTVTLHNASATALGQAAEELGIVVLDDHGFVEITLTLENTGSDTLQLTAFANEDPILVKDPLTTREYPSLRPDMVLPGFLDPGEMVTTRAVFQVPKEADTLVLKLVYSFTGRDWSTAFLMLPD